MRAPGSLPHLVRRFFGSLRSRPPSPEEQRAIAGVLTPGELRVFWEQPAMDQRHALTVAARVAAHSDDPLLARCALLHDVGKRRSRTGVLGRSIASGLALLHLPVTPRLRAYLDHGRLGAADLAALGSHPTVVAFAEHHHHVRPPGVSAPAWDLLSAADDE